MYLSEAASERMESVRGPEVSSAGSVHPVSHFAGKAAATTLRDAKRGRFAYPYFAGKSRFIFGIVFRGNESVQFHNDPALPEQGTLYEYA
jgi:hypothetical protein